MFFKWSDRGAVGFSQHWEALDRPADEWNEM